MARWLPWVPILVVAGALAGVVHACWFWDDIRLIVHNPVVQNLDWVSAATRHLWWGLTGDDVHGNVYYRPLLLLSFLIDRWMGAEAGGAHLHSLAWHLGAVAAVHRLARLEAGPIQATIAALIFGLHPAVVESVLWVAARNDLMMLGFLLWAALLIRENKHLLCGLFVLCAALSKETGLLAPLFLWLLTGRWSWASVGAVVIALLLRIGIPMGAGGGADWKAAVILLSQLSLPWPLVGVLWMPAAQLSWLHIVGSLLSLILLGVLRVPIRLLAAALLLLLPGWWSVGYTELCGERFLYGTIAVLAIGIAPQLRRGGWPMGVIAGMLALGMIGVRLSEWSSEEALLRVARERAPSSLISARLGLVLEGEGQKEEALQMYEEGLRMVPVFTQACGRPVRMLREEGREEEARSMEAFCAQ